MRTKITLVLLFLNVAVFAFIFYIEPHLITEESLRQTSNHVLGPEAANIIALEISSRASPQPLRIEKNGDTWLLSQPAGWPANLNAVSRILTELQTLEHDTSFLVADIVKNGQTLADYGLDQPQFTITFTSGTDSAQAAQTYTLRIGAETRIGNRLYVLSPDGTRIHVVDRSLADSLTLPLDQLRDNALFTIPVFEARALRLQIAGPPVAIHRDGDRWSFESPILARADKSATELALKDLTTLNAQTFLDAREADDRTGLATPALRITIDGNNRRESLLLGNPVTPAPAGSAPTDTLFYAKMDDKPVVFTVSFPNDLLQNLRNAQEILREKHFVDFDPHNVTAITLHAPNAPELTLQRLEAPAAATDNARWQIVQHSPGAGPQTQPADLAVIQRLLENLSLLSAQKFVSDAPSGSDLESWGFNRPEREITLALAPAGAQPATLSTPPSTLTVQLGLGSDASVYARISGVDSVYAVDPSILAATPVATRAYRDRLLRDLPAGAKITGLKLTRLADKTVLFEKSLAVSADNTKPATWDAVLASEPADRRAALQALLAALRTLRAKDFVLDEFPSTVPVGGENRPWSYQLDTTISLAAASGAPATTTTTLLSFTERISGGTQLAGSPEFGVFEAEQPLLDALFTLTTAPPPVTAPAAENPVAKPQPSQ
ncbi:MAG TPA: DUF4340 domain-containing protein [Opitutaceae bacterium]|jgi:hypothetical protein|nr:DUF4340 domain-containing protein [Opitutaceae bacterium]